MYKVALITGCSSGLGLEFYKAVQSYELDEIIIISRKKEKLEEIKEDFGKIKTTILALDLSASNSLTKIKETLDNIDNIDLKLLINNAGFGLLSPLESSDIDIINNMIDLNIKSLTLLTRICLDYMSKESEIINVSSIASFVPNANMSVYSASKAYVTSFSLSLKDELKKRKINVLALCPGPMETDFLKRAKIEKGTSKAFDNLPRVNPKKAVLGALKASRKHKAIYTPKFFYKFYRFVAKIIPTNILIKVART